MIDRALLLLCFGCTLEDPPLICAWHEVAAWELPEGRTGPPGQQCIEVTAPEFSRVTTEPLDPCDAEEYGAARLVVPQGTTVYQYSTWDPDGEPGTFHAGWEACP